jgi:hypothetical protein
VFSATSYDVARSSDGTNYTIITTTNGTSMTDNAVAPNTAYLYKVRANAGATTTAYSAPDLATTVIFTDPVLLGVTIKAVHITELRTAVNAVRVLAGMSLAAFTDPTITAGTTRVKAAHVNELRSNVDAARATLGLAALPPYTDPTLTTGTTVKAQHILDLRSRVQ